ncbi:MAG: class A beta-lactamase-related serine hydrolase [Bacteroidetes bacterium]|nr:MAG: class A beta-lactamase-related serine hydrolase [Bacteroidota bacterium]
MQLRAEGALELDDPIATYLDSSLLQGLHVYEGQEYSYDLTIRQLLAHTTGLPDYFEGEGSNGRSLKDEMVSGHDRFFSFADILARTRAMTPHFAPGTPGKAHYSDTNYQLLGKVIEALTGESYAANGKARIIDPLGLTHTYLYQDSTDQKPYLFYAKSAPLHIPQSMVSFGPDGGIVSTSKELLAFTRAFFTGQLFPTAYLAEMQSWNDLFTPMQAGVGVQRLNLPWYFDPTGIAPELIGHVGLSGVVAYYSPEEDLFIVGTVNQLAHPEVAIQTLLKLIGVARRAA